jgi:hypothetical protein
MKIGAAFPGAYIKAVDLQGKRVQVVIDRVELEDIGGEQKPVLHFKGKDRGLVLNKTNSNAVVGIVGTDETDDWGGAAVVLYPSMTDFQGKRVACIRIDPPDRPTKGKAVLQPKVVDPEPIDEGHAAQYDDESVPF